jgi:hypothetical protein
MRKFVFVLLLIGAIGSVLLMLNAGRHTPALLILLFVGWVVSPYLALFWVCLFSKLHSFIAPEILYGLPIVISCGSLAAYGVTLFQHRNKPPTGVYLSIPFLSWILIVVIISLTVYRKRKTLKVKGGTN